MKRIVYVTAAMAIALAACNKKTDDTATTTDANMAMANDMAANDMAAGNAMAGNAMAGTADTAFLADAIKGDNAEVANGKLAQAQGMSQKVKDFGAMLVTDHGAHKDKVAALLTGAGGTATDEPSDEGKAAMAKLQALKGADFDKAFKAAMIDDHTKDIAKYTKQSMSSDAATAQLAKDTLPTLKKHLEAAKAL